MSRDLQTIHVKSFINRLHLVFHVCVETFDVMFFYVYGIYRVRTKHSLACKMTYSHKHNRDVNRGEIETMCTREQILQ